MSVLERIRNRDPTLTQVVVTLNDDGLTDFAEALPECPHVRNVELTFNLRVNESLGECKALLSYLRHSTVLRFVSFECHHLHQLPPDSPQRQAVLQAFVQTMAAANANPNVELVTFDIAFLTADELLSDATFYQSLKRVRLRDSFGDVDSERETQTMQQGVRALSSLETFQICREPPQWALSLLRPLHSHTSLQHLSVDNLGETNMETAHALSGVLSSSPLTRLTVSWNIGCFTAEAFEIIAQGLLHCPTLDHLELFCYDVAETNVLQAARFFHQCSTKSSIRHLSLDGNWKTSAVVRSILSVPVNGPSLPVTAHSIGASLQTLTLSTVDEELLVLFATNPSRLPHLSIGYVDEIDWLQLCNILPVLIYLQELSIENFQVTSSVVARTAMLQALRANGSLQTLTIGHGWRGPTQQWREPTQQLFTAIELRFVDAYCQRNRIAQALCRRRTDSLDRRVVVDDNSGIVPDPTCIPYLLQAMQPAQRMAPTVLMAHAQRLDGS